jgi:hypothetical protein
VVSWGKASLSPAANQYLKVEGAAALHSLEVPSLLDRVKSKLKRARLN